MKIAPEKISAYINFLYQRKYQTNAPPELLEKWNRVPYNLINIELNNLYTHWEIGPTKILQLEQAFNNQFGSSSPPVPTYSNAPPPYNPKPSPNPATENLYASFSGSGETTWKMISIILIGLMAIGAGYYFLTKDNGGTEKPSNDGSIMSSNTIKREEPIVKTETPAATTNPEATAQFTLPKMSSPEAQKFVEEYDGFMKNYLAAMKSKDASKMTELATGAQEWATKAQGMASKMTTEDAKAWSDYAQKWAVEIQNAMK